MYYIIAHIFIIILLSKNGLKHLKHIYIKIIYSWLIQEVKYSTSDVKLGYIQDRESG